MSSSAHALRFFQRVTHCRPLSTGATLRACTTRRIASTLPRAFSTSGRIFASGERDLPLASKIQEELVYEQEAAAKDTTSRAFLEHFIEEGIWKIEENPGQDEVALVRDFGNENIRVLFSIVDLDIPAEQEYEDDIKEKETEADEPASEPSFAIRTFITIAKEGKGALSIDAVAQDGAFVVENVAFYSNEGLATDVTAEADWKRRGLYLGPQFDHLDVEVQELFDQYLEERGINSSLALFIPEYAELKEQKEYTKWLGKVRSFVEA